MTDLNNLLGEVDWNSVEEIGFKPLPVGTYGAKIVKAELKMTKDSFGQRLSIEYALLGGKGVANRRVFDNINLKNKSEKATQIGMGALKKLLITLGLDCSSFVDSQVLVGQMIGLKLKIEQSEEHGDTNKIKDYVKFEDHLLEVSANTETEPSY